MSSELDPVSRLVQHSTSIVSDALDELGMHCVLPEIRAQRVGQPRIAGVALPVWFKPKAHDPDAYRFGGGVGKPLEQVLRTMQDGDVVVMDLGGTVRSSAGVAMESRVAQRSGVTRTSMVVCGLDLG
jgi:regulator of RNase E activity RraA